MSRLSDTDLDARVVLALSAFFGLVVGFGYGALRFKGFLGSIRPGTGRMAKTQRRLKSRRQGPRECLAGIEPATHGGKPLHPIR